MKTSSFYQQQPSNREARHVNLEKVPLLSLQFN